MEPALRFRTLDWLRYAAVLTVMLNHFSSTLLHLPSPLFGPAVYVEPARAGITFLFVSSGFILHWRYAAWLDWGSKGRMAMFLARRLWVLGPPVMLVVAMDLFAGSTAVETRAGSVAIALPAFATLTQSWTFATMGNATTMFPWDAANLAWLASDLLFLYLLYLLVFPSARILGRGGAIAAGVALAAMQWGAFSWVTMHQPAVLAAAGEIFGARAVSPETLPVYSALKWLTFYAPYFRAFEFLIGVMLAQVCRAGGPAARKGAVVAGVVLVATGLVSYAVAVAPSNLVAPAFRYDCLACGLVLLAWAAGASTITRTTWVQLPLSGYILWISHMFWFNAYALPPLLDVSSRDAWFIAGRLTMLTAFVVVTSYGLWELWWRSTPSWLGPLRSEKEDA
ncbi:MAG: hypothetical protein HZA32_18625 [Opitutae bacterium]|nr:hypothetical protein [Opitutae bacterium]